MVCVACVYVLVKLFKYKYSILNVILMPENVRLLKCFDGGLVVLEIFQRKQRKENRWLLLLCFNPEPFVEFDRVSEETPWKTE